MNNITTFTLSSYANQMNALKQDQEEYKDKIKAQFRESMNLPRKTKKRVRKILRLDWAIACWADSFFE